jgi:hypothetical protein
MNKFDPKSYFPSFTPFHFQLPKKEVSGFKEKMNLLAEKEKMAKKGTYQWLSRNKDGAGLTYTKAKYGELNLSKSTPLK